jgi:hypothetical protein
MALKLLGLVRAKYSADFPVEDLFRMATIQRMSSYISVCLDPSNIDKLSDEEVIWLLDVMGESD